jgi:hypothetical protein
VFPQAGELLALAWEGDRDRGRERVREVVFVRLSARTHDAKTGEADGLRTR